MSDRELLEKTLREYILSRWPKRVTKEVRPGSLGYTKLAQWAVEDSLDLERVQFEIRLDYALAGFLQLGVDSRKKDWSAKFVPDPLCWTNYPSNWWWRQRRHREDFKFYLTTVAGSINPIFMNIPDVERVPYPRLVEGKRKEDDYVEELFYWRFAKS